MHKTKVLFLIFISIFIGSCEKDDICVDGDTPLLVIEFYDNDTFGTEEEVLKAVPKLRVGGDRQEFTVNTVADRTDLEKIEIPLRVNETSTTYHFIQNSADDATTMAETGNDDVITFNYTNKEVFISRACGFVMNFDELSQSLTADADNWIKEIVISETLVETQAVTHVKIYH